MYSLVTNVYMKQILNFMSFHFMKANITQFNVRNMNWELCKTICSPQPEIPRKLRNSPCPQEVASQMSRMDIFMNRII